jgi:rhodanese-related sulfurtransferase
VAVLSPSRPLLHSEINVKNIMRAATQVRQVLLESLLVAILGLALAFAANALSPRGFKLTQNYFPGDSIHRNPQTASTNGPAPSSAHALAEHLKAKGLGFVDGSKAAELFRDPQYEQGLIVFIDSRGDEEYLKGHIPGAYQFDHFYFEKYLPVIIPACQAAQQVVVYCGGGDNCELSENAATMLGNDLGIPKQKLFVYGGGMNEWKSKSLPIETGHRKAPAPNR